MLQLITKVDHQTKVLMTPMGVQIWMKDRKTHTAKDRCEVCGAVFEEGQAYYTPVAGAVLVNPDHRIHETCADSLELLPMQVNAWLIEETKESSSVPESA